MNSESKQTSPEFTSEQQAEFSKLTLEFLKRHFSEEIITGIEIEVKYNPVNKEGFALFQSSQAFATAGCVIGSPLIPGDPCALINRVWR